MGEWSDEVKEYHEDVKKERIGWAAEATASVLRMKMMKNPKTAHKKSSLFEDISAEAKNIHVKKGAFHAPSVLHPSGQKRNLKIPKPSFIRNNWTDIVKRCANYPNPDYRVYIVWVGGKEGGVRIGTREEFQNQQAILEAISKGVAEEHNERTDIINADGGSSGRIEVKALPLPAPSRVTRIFGRRK